jgi:hypothetical protein
MLFIAAVISLTLSGSGSVVEPSVRAQGESRSEKRWGWGPSALNEDAVTLLHRVIEAQERRERLSRDYVFRETTVTRDLDPEGTVRSVESEVLLVTPAAGGEYRRLEGKDGRPLSPEEEAREERKFQKYLKEQLALSPEERDKKAQEQLDRRVKRYRERLREAIEVYDFEPLEDEAVQGVPLRVFHFRPKPGYQGHSRATRIFACMEGEVWIDPARDQLARLDLRVVKSLKFLGGIFGRLSEGSAASARGWFDGEELWLLDDVSLSLDARLYFMKTYRQQIEIDYHDYQRYRVETEEKIRLGKTPSGK